jgi:tetratricopeptide (TPR) repeat protein
VRIGQVIAGRFRIRSLIGSGGMGRVYRAIDETTEQSVALKVLSLDAKKYSRRFLREAKVMAELSHPNIVSYVDYGETDRGAPYIVMEWVKGEDLRQRMNRKKIELSEALDVIAGTGEALAFAHSRGVIHRDLKPSNLMLVGGNIQHIKLLDFGIARWRGPAVEKMTQTGISIGTPGYMAPEQSRGDSNIDGRADLYALGCVIYECLVGKRPFQGEDIATMLTRSEHEEPPRVSEARSDISSAFDDLLADMMSGNVQRRPADGNVMAARARNIESSSLTSTLLDLPDTGLSPSERELLSLILVDGEVAEGADKARDDDSALAEIAKRAGGRVRHLDDGSALLTCLDARGSATDVALRAVQCALAVRALRPSGRMSIATGLGEVGALNSHSALMIQAAKLRATAEVSAPRSRPLSIRVDETTYRLLDGRFDIRRRREDTAPGLDLLGEQLEDHSTTVPAGAPPCIGREGEIAEIRNLFDKSVSESTAHAVVVVGEAGVGKSRLSGEVFTQIRDTHPEAEIWAARGDLLGERETFGLLGRILRQACGIVWSDGLAERRQKVFEQVRKYIGSADSEQVAEFLGELCGTPFPADSSRRHLHAARGNALLMGEQMRKAWEQFLSAVSKSHPVLLVIEDAHGADLPTLKMLASSLRNASSGSWMLLALARPEIDAASPNLWGEEGARRIELGGLSESSCREMIHSLLGHTATDATVGRLVGLSGGNALYLEELLRSVKLYRSTKISNTVLVLMMLRLHPLAPELKRVLRAASLFGPSFPMDGLQKLLGSSLSPSELESLLGKLVAQDFLAPVSDPENPLADYRFTDELMREAAYNTLTRSDRAQGHQIVGGWLQESGVRDGLLLARHFELGRDAQRAATWYQHAAQDALEDNDLADAMKRAQRGIDTGAGGEPLGYLHATMASALLWTGDNSKAGEQSMMAMDLLAESSPGWAVAAGDAATALGRCGAFFDIQSIAQKLLAAKPTQGYGGPAVSALARCATQLFQSDHYDEASAILDKLPPEANILADSDPSAHGHLLSALAHRHLHSGDLSSHLRLSHGAAAHFQSCGDRRSAALAQINVGFSYGQLGDYASAERVLRDALDVAGELDLGSIDSLARTNLGRILLATGEYSEAWDLELVAIESFQMQGDDRMANHSRVYLSRVHQRQGALDSAESQAREALHGTNTVATVRMQAHAQLASVLLDLARPEEALKSAIEAGSILGSVGHIADGESFVRLTLVDAHIRCEQKERARAALSSAHATLLDRFNRIADPSLRLSFVEQVEENARIVELATAWGVNGEG